MDVLAEHRRLQNQITKALQRHVIALVFAHLLTLPFLKRMGAAAANLNMVLRRCAQNALLHGGELRCHLVDVVAHAGRDLEHAFGDIVLHLTSFNVIFHGVDQGRGVLA